MFHKPSFRVGGVRSWREGWLDLRARFNVGEFKPESFLYCKAVYRGERVSAAMLIAGNLFRDLLQKHDFEVRVKPAPDHWLWGMLYC